MATQVPEQTPRNQYTATGGQTIFPYTFLTYDQDELLVTQNGVTLLVTVNYTVSGLGVVTGGNVTLLSGATAGDVITISRDMELKRDTDYQDNGDFLAETVNLDFNRLWMTVQEINAANDLALKLDNTDDLTGIDSPFYLPSKALRSGKGLGFDVAGNPIAIDVVAGGSSSASQISYTNLLSVVESVQDGIERNELKTRNAFLFATDSGTANNYVLTESTGVTPTAYYVGGSIQFTPANTNTGASVANLNGLGSYNLLTNAGAALPAGFLTASRGTYTFIFTGFDLRFLDCATVFYGSMEAGTPGYKISYDSSGAAVETPDLKWVTLANSGQLTSGTSYAFTDIPSSATKIEIDITNVDVNTSSENLLMTVGYGATPTYLGSSGDYIGSAAQVNSGNTTTVAWDTSAAVVFTDAQVDVKAGGIITLNKINDGSDTWSIHSSGQFDAGSAYPLFSSQGRVKGASLITALTAIKLEWSNSKSFANGYLTCKYYGNSEI